MVGTWLCGRPLPSLAERDGEARSFGRKERRGLDPWLCHLRCERISFFGLKAHYEPVLITFQSCPGTGDDTPHIALPYYSVPDFVGSTPPTVTNDVPIDLVFVDFTESQVLQVLNSLQSTKNYTKSDVLEYSPLLTNEVLGLFAQAKWN